MITTMMMMMMFLYITYIFIIIMLLPMSIVITHIFLSAIPHMQTKKIPWTEHVCLCVCTQFISSLSLVNTQPNMWAHEWDGNMNVRTTHMYGRDTNICIVCTQERGNRLSDDETQLTCQKRSWSLYSICAMHLCVCVLAKRVEFKTRAQQNGHHRPNTFGRMY